jgi:predicted nucleic acid-binding protein
MGLKIFLDANIVLDFILKRDAYALSLQIMKMVVQGKVRAFITPSIIQISGYWITKVHGHAKAKELLSTLLNDVRLIDIEHEVAQLALQSSIPEIEDALQYYTAIHHQLDYFITLDKALVKYSSPVLPIIHPTEFLDKFSDMNI